MEVSANISGNELVKHLEVRGFEIINETPSVTTLYKIGISRPFPIRTNVPLTEEIVEVHLINAKIEKEDRISIIENLKDTFRPRN